MRHVLFCLKKRVKPTRNWALALQLFFLLSVLFARSQAWASQDFITERSWFEDASAQQSWPDIQKQATHRYTGVLSKGYGRSALWLKLHIDPSAQPTAGHPNDSLVLRIRPLQLDDIRVYDPLLPDGLVGITGDQSHPRDAQLQGMDFLLPIVRGETPRDIWVRLVSTSARQIDVQLLSPSAFNTITAKQQLVFAIYVGLVSCFALWALTHWLFTRDHMVGAFGLAQTMALLYALSSLGFLRAFWPQDWPAWLLDQGTSVFSMTAVSSAILFHVLLINEFAPPPGVRRVLWAMPALIVPKLVLLQTSWLVFALQLNMLEVLVAPIVFLGVVSVAQGWANNNILQRPAISKPVIVAFYLVLVIVLMIAALPGLGLVPTDGELALYVVQSHGLLTAVLILTLLQYRAYVQRQQQQTVVMELEHSQLQRQQDRTTREEQDKLFAMLAHELKTPLATIHMRLDTSVAGNDVIKTAINDMNRVIDRCVQTSRMSELQLVLHTETFDLAELMRASIQTCAKPERVHLDAPAQLQARTDRQLVLIVFNNLLENACKYAPPNSPIHVVLRETLSGHSAEVEIRNWPFQNQWPDARQLFNKYYRAPHAKRQTGTGLGLYLVRSLIETLGGQVSYEPDDAWIRFVVKLPI